MYSCGKHWHLVAIERPPAVPAGSLHSKFKSLCDPAWYFTSPAFECLLSTYLLNARSWLCLLSREWKMVNKTIDCHGQHGPTMMEDIQTDLMDCFLANELVPNMREGLLGQANCLLACSLVCSCFCCSSKYCYLFHPKASSLLLMWELLLNDCIMTWCDFGWGLCLPCGLRDSCHQVWGRGLTSQYENDERLTYQ